MRLLIHYQYEVLDKITWKANFTRMPTDPGPVGPENHWISGNDVISRILDTAGVTI
jgi:hypothetical protein